jgi:hypothetical protein
MFKKYVPKLGIVVHVNWNIVDLIKIFVDVTCHEDIEIISN